MADEGHLDAVTLIKLFFKGKDHQHSVHITLDLVNAMFLPRPELRADEKDHRNAQAVEFAGEAKVDIGKVDEHGGIRQLRLSELRLRLSLRYSP